MPLTKYRELLGEKFDEANAVAAGLKTERDQARQELGAKATELKAAQGQVKALQGDLATARQGQDAQLAALTAERDRARADLDATSAGARQFRFAVKLAQAAGVRDASLIEKGVLATDGLSLDDQGNVAGDAKAWAERLKGAGFDWAFGADGVVTTGGGPEPGRRTDPPSTRSKGELARERARRDAGAAAHQPPALLKDGPAALL